MRVSKEVRNFIGEQVKEIFEGQQNEQLQELKQQDEQAKAIVAEFNEELKTIIENKRNELQKRLQGFDVGTDYEYKNYITKFYLECNSKNYRKQRTIERDRQTKISKAIQDIIITLELGGNKQDLMNMLEKLKEDNK